MTFAAPPGETASGFSRLRFGRLLLWPVIAAVAVGAVALIPPHASMGAAMIALFYMVYATLLLAALSACRRAGVSPGAIFGSFPRSRRAWLTTSAIGPLALLFSAVSLWAVVTVASHMLPGWASDQVAGKSGAEGLFVSLDGVQRLLLAFNVTLLAPAVEEFVFRGMLMRRWISARRRGGFWVGLLGSSLTFALFHPPNWLGSFAFGIMAGVLYLWSGSLLLPIVAHAVNNLFVTTMLLSSGMGPSAEPVPSLQELQSQWITPVVSALVVGAVIVAVLRPMLPDARARAAGEVPAA